MPKKNHKTDKDAAALASLCKHLLANTGPWTQFMDMHSGGGTKEPYDYIYIEAPKDEAKIIFYNRFGHNPERVSCTCCGDDYSISESETFTQSSAYERGCDYSYFRPDGTECDRDEAWKPGKGTAKGYTSRYVERVSRNGFGREYKTIAEYSKEPHVLIIPAYEIKDGERVGKIPEQGYVWVD